MSKHITLSSAGNTSGGANQKSVTQNKNTTWKLPGAAHVNNIMLFYV